MKKDSTTDYQLKISPATVMARAPFILLINPWITDFAAHDLWAKPLGLLLLGSLLRAGGFGVAFLDCLDRHDPFTNSHSDILPGASHKYGTGKYPKMPVPLPEAYAGVPRKYFRYGIHPESLYRRLEELPAPDLVWVTSIMTYWYPGVRQTIEALRDVFPQTPVWLGGIYARLCPSHAREKSGADEIVTIPTGALSEKLEAALGFSLRNRHLWRSLHSFLPPALDLLPHLSYAPIITSSGCPFQCPYCASRILHPGFIRRSAAAIYAEVLKWHSEYDILDFAFYDDALLIDADSTLKPALERICTEGPRIRFHTPNALHIRALTPEWCTLLRGSGFTTIRMGLETTRAEKHREWGGKLEIEMFHTAVENLRAAGFASDQIGVYLLCGLPDQSPNEVADAIDEVQRSGAMPFLAEYSPVPRTSMWPEARSASAYDIEAEPLYHNNTFFACRRPDFSFEDLQALKQMARRARCFFTPHGL